MVSMAGSTTIPNNSLIKDQQVEEIELLGIQIKIKSTENTEFYSKHPPTREFIVFLSWVIGVTDHAYKCQHISSMELKIVITLKTFNN